MSEDTNNDDPSKLSLTSEFTTDHPDYVQPMIISEPFLGEENSLFNYFFNLDLTTWQKFSVDKELSNALVSFHHLPPSLKRVHNLYVPTIDSIKFSYLIECYVVS
jgi:hypothetical protein